MVADYQRIRDCRKLLLPRIRFSSLQKFGLSAENSYDTEPVLCLLRSSCGHDFPCQIDASRRQTITVSVSPTSPDDTYDLRRARSGALRRQGHR